MTTTMNTGVPQPPIDTSKVRKIWWMNPAEWKRFRQNRLVSAPSKRN